MLPIARSIHERFVNFRLTWMSQRLELWRNWRIGRFVYGTKIGIQFLIGCTKWRFESSWELRLSPGSLLFIPCISGNRKSTSAKRWRTFVWKRKSGDETSRKERARSWRIPRQNSRTLPDNTNLADSKRADSHSANLWSFKRRIANAFWVFMTWRHHHFMMRNKFIVFISSLLMKESDEFIKSPNPDS